MRSHAFRRWLSATALLAAAALPFLAGCPAGESDYAKCDPGGYWLSPPCLDDGGTDGGSDAEPDAGTDAAPNAQGSCPGVCVRGPSDDHGALWSEPLLVWFGPANEVPADCSEDPNHPDPNHPEDVKFRLFSDLIAPPASCDTCECAASTGTCEGLPETIEVRAGTCAETGATALPFGGPAGWDGSCTSENALPAGALCGGEYCAQSVWASPLPGPVEESCEVKTLPVPKFNVETRWANAALACGANAPSGVCADDREYCARARPLPWNVCSWRAGKWSKCPEHYPVGPSFYYDELPIDNRNCTKCECGAPVGSACFATLHLYDDNSCTAQQVAPPLSSLIEQCTNVQPPGRVLGGKSITDLSYMPGTCLANGGEPIGEAHENGDTTVTFCCVPPFAG